jgi:hypothetical protein
MDPRRLPGSGAQPEPSGLDSATRKLEIQRLKKQLELYRITCATLEREFQSPSVRPEEKTKLLIRWNEVMRDRELAQSMLSQLEWEEQESGDSRSSPR